MTVEVKLGSMIKCYRKNQLVIVRATECKKCGHFHSGGGICGHKLYPFKEYPWIVWHCRCMDLDSWYFIEEKVKV